MGVAIALVSIPDRDSGEFQVEQMPRLIRELKVSIPDRDSGEFQVESARGSVGETQRFNP